MLVFFPKIVFGSFFITMLLGAIACLALLLVAGLTIRRYAMSSLLMLAVFFAACWTLLRVSDDVRTVGRWIIYKNTYKAEVLSQPSSTDSRLKHVEWDDWGGFAGVGGTVLYLVFDPNDSLASAARTGFPGKFSGLPCEVLHVRRVESQWYIVLFYSETDWEHC